MALLTLGTFDKNNCRYPVYLDGELLNDCYVSASSANDGPKERKGEFDLSKAKRILELTAEDLSEHFSLLTLYQYTEKDYVLDTWLPGHITVECDLEGEGFSNIDIEITFDVEFWNRSYSIAELAATMQKEEDPDQLIFYYQIDEESLLEGFGITVPSDISSPIGDAIFTGLNWLSDLRPKIEEELYASSDRVLVRQFDFPESIRTSCEQYLMYFGQFLKDLGIDADTEIKERSSQVLFSVRPRDKGEALDKIKEALDSYLQMPGSSSVASALGAERDIAAMQLRANVLHLESQIMIARAVIEAKDATISAKQAEIDIFRAAGLRAYLPQNAAGKSDSESIIDGVLSVKKFEHKGIELDLPSIVRKLKRKL